MTVSLDQFPYYDPLLKKGTDKISDAWMTNMSTFIQTLSSYLSQYGIFVPNMTTGQRDTIQSPQPGQMIYNTDIPAPQIYQAGAWKTFTTT